MRGYFPACCVNAIACSQQTRRSGVSPAARSKTATSTGARESVTLRRPGAGNVRLLFVKSALAWPRSSGHDVYTYHTMKACAALGHDVSMALTEPPRPEAIEGLDLKALYRFDQVNGSAWQESSTWLQRRFRSFFGIPNAHLSG